MSFQLTPLSNFILDADRSPMTRKEYQAMTRPVSSSFSAPAEIITEPEEDKVEISSRDELKAYMRRLASQFSANSSATLIRSIGSSFFGYSQGLYAGVGQLPAHQVGSLIRKYA